MYAERDWGRIELRKKPSWYHPLEEITELEMMKDGEARLSPAETTRTIIEVNSNATLMFSGFLTSDEHDSIFWPDLSYVTDEHGNIYFQVKNDEDILRSLTTEDNFVQVMIGLDTKELQSELSAPSEIDFSVDEFDDEDSDASLEEEEDDDDNSEDDEEGEDEIWASVLEDEEDEDDDDSLGDWAELDTMRTTHPTYFAKKMAEVVSGDPVDCMNQPPAGLIILGLLRPATIDEDSVIQINFPDKNFRESGKYQTDGNGLEKIEDLGHINGKSSQDGSTWEADLEKDKSPGKGTAFYKLRMINIQLISARGQRNVVEVEKLRNAQPDAIALSAPKIMSRLKAGGEETVHALQSLCWRCNGIKAEEAMVIGVDSLGFDLRVCSGKQIETLRFTFPTRACSEYSAERQLNDLLFPRTHRYQRNNKEAH